MCKASILSSMGVVKADSHSASGEPDFSGPAMCDSKWARERTWFSVVSRESMVRRSWRDKLSG